MPMVLEVTKERGIKKDKFLRVSSPIRPILKPFSSIPELFSLRE
jgi:hypothetical protein